LQLEYVEAYGVSLNKIMTKHHRTHSHLMAQYRWRKK